uniref:LigA n=1 Tax=Parastrongyloides trichosuri TaxID=131310 RepID=A0A0N4ZGW4_PARTI
MPVEQAAAGHDDARRAQHGLGLVLVHRQGRGQDAGVGVGNLQRLKDALDAAVLAPFAVQGVEDHVGLQRGQHLGQIAPGVDARDLGHLPFQGVRAAATRGQRDLAFRRQAAHQDSDMEGVQGRTHGDIRRLARPYALNTVNRATFSLRGEGLRTPDPLDFPVQLHARLFQHVGADGFAQPLDVGGGRLAGVDHEVGVQLAELGAAAGDGVQLAAPARVVDQLPRRMAVRVLEGRAAGLFADRLGLLAPLGDLLDAGGDGLGRVGRAAIGRLDPDDVGRSVGVAVGIAEVGQGQFDPLAPAVQAPGGDQHVLGFRAVAARIHGQGAADGAGDARIELQPGDARLGRGARHHAVQRACARRDGVAVGRHLAPSAARQTDHHALDPPVAHDQVGADADRRDGHAFGQGLQEIGQIIGVGRDEQGVRRAAHAEPG